MVTTTMNQYLLSFFILLSKLGLCCAVGTSYVANYQLFPVSVVATAFGILNIAGRSSTILAPFIVELKPFSISQWTFVAITILASITSMSLITDKDALKK